MSKNPVLTEAQEAAQAAQRREAVMPRTPIDLDRLAEAQDAAQAAALLDARPARRRRPLGITLPPDLIDALDAVAAKEEQSRAKMMEIILRQGIAERGVPKAGDQEAHEAIERLAQLDEVAPQLAKRTT